MSKYVSAPIGGRSFGSIGNPHRGSRLPVPRMRYFTILLSAIPITGCAAFSYEPAGEQEFQQIASGGCRNRDGDFIIRGLVSNAGEDTVVLFDPDDSRSTISLSLPGRGPLHRVKGVFGRHKFEATDARLNELRQSRTPVVVTLRCQGDGTPIARTLSYRNVDGSSESISY